jgi:hypothetical protein
VRFVKPLLIDSLLKIFLPLPTGNLPFENQTAIRGMARAFGAELSRQAGKSFPKPLKSLNPLKPGSQLDVRMNSLTFLARPGASALGPNFDEQIAEI